MLTRIAALVAAAALLVSCTGGESGEQSGDGGSVQSQVSDYRGPPVEGGVLRVGVARIRSLDPAQAASPEEQLVAEQLFDALTTFDPASGAARPALAASWQGSPDQQHWDFTLRPGAHFSNGREVNSGDVKFTMERIARKGSTSPVAPLLQRVVGYRAFHDEGRAPGLAGITTPAPDRVRFDLDQPLAELPWVLGNPAFGIVPREAADAPGFADRPVGSGPFTVRERRGDDIELSRVPGASGFLEGILFKVERDESSSYASFVRGRLDWTLVPPDRVEEASRRKPADLARPYLGEVFYGFNLKNPKFADLRFREAVVRAVDREAIVKVIYGGTAKASSGVVAEGVPGHQPAACGEKCRHDPGRARDLLRQVFGTRTPPEVKIDFDEDPTQEAIAKAIQANLREAGIPAGIRPHRYTDYLGFAQSGQQEIFRLGWVAPYPTADAFLSPLFTSGLPDNITGFSSPQVDRLLRTARAEPDEGRRIGMYQEAERLVMDQLPILPVAQFVTHALAAPNVRGLTVSALGTFDASQVWLAPVKGERGRARSTTSRPPSS